MEKRLSRNDFQEVHVAVLVGVLQQVNLLLSGGVCPRLVNLRCDP